MMRRCSDGRNYGRNYDRFKNICGFWWEMLNTLYRIWVCWCIVLQGTVIVIHGFFFSPLQLCDVARPTIIQKKI
jgi:hypothetical protein